MNDQWRRTMTELWKKITEDYGDIRCRWLTDDDLWNEVALRSLNTATHYLSTNINCLDNLLTQFRPVVSLRWNNYDGYNDEVELLFHDSLVNFSSLNSSTTDTVALQNSYHYNIHGLWYFYDWYVPISMIVHTSYDSVILHAAHTLL